MVHLSMVSDGFDAVVHDALLSSMVRGGDGRGGVCDDPFLHPHTLVGHHDYDQINGNNHSPPAQAMLG